MKNMDEDTRFFYMDEPAEEMPVLALRGLVVFPGNIFHFDVGRKKSVVAIETAIKTNRKIFLTPQLNLEEDEPTTGNLCLRGTVAVVRQIIKHTEEGMRVLVEGVSRAEILKFTTESNKDGIRAIVSVCIENYTMTDKITALTRQLKTAFVEYIEVSPKMAKDIVKKIATTSNPTEIADLIATNVNFSYEDKQLLISDFDIQDRLRDTLFFLSSEVNIQELEAEIAFKVKHSLDKNQREYYLREQMKVISEELGEVDDVKLEAENIRDEIYSLCLPDDIEERLLKEAYKLYRMPYGSHEENLLRNYLETCLSLPWNNQAKIKINLSKAEKILDKDHYGLDKIKERIIEMLAVRKRAPEMKGQIICLVGPPGVGKTSIVKSIAKAIGTKYVRIALGGVKDEAEIRGHRRTYIGAMPGRVITAIKNCGVNNPLVLFDEIDKLGNDFKGDPTSAMLEVLDAEQNNTFEDHYINLPFDLSNVMFMTTANDENAIPAPLKDRMEIIELFSYTYEEKFNIAKKHLVPKQMKKHSLTAKDVRITDKAIRTMIEGYTREAGVRNLERTIADVLRKVVKKFVENKEQKKITIDDKNLEEFLGKKKYRSDILSKEDEIGLVNGLAWTSVGGEILPIEVAVMDGTGKLELTGSLGDVMKESAKAALTCVRTRSKQLGIDPDFYTKKDIHLHAPEGAIPKDGPSAGTAMAVAIASALSDKPINHDVAMTGEITLRGRVLVIGGLKEKAIAAYKNGIKNVLIPETNLPDLEEVDEKVKQHINFIPITKFEEAIEHSLIYKSNGKKSKVKTKKKIEADINSIIKSPKTKKEPAIV